MWTILPFKKEITVNYKHLSKWDIDYCNPLLIIIDLILTAILVMDKLKRHFFACKYQRSQILINK